MAISSPFPVRQGSISFPKVSIITASYNCSKTIEKTILSVKGQSYPNIQFIVIDGGSDDGTLDIVRQYEKDIFYWVSEPDNGIYHALNKGLSVANGEVIGILNADDTYCEDAIQKVMPYFSDDVDMVYGKVSIVRRKGNIRRIVSPLPKDQILSKGLQEMSIPHVALFVKKKVYDKLSGFNERYEIAGDHDFVLRAFKQGSKAMEIQDVLAEVLEGGISSGIKCSAEFRDVAIANGRSVFKANIMFFKTVVWNCIRMILEYFLPQNWIIRFAGIIGSRHYG